MTLLELLNSWKDCKVKQAVPISYNQDQDTTDSILVDLDNGKSFIIEGAIRVSGSMLRNQITVFEVKD